MAIGILMRRLTAWPLAEALHDDVELGEGEDAVLVLVEEHEDLLELGDLLVGQLPFVLEQSILLVLCLVAFEKRTTLLGCMCTLSRAAKCPHMMPATFYQLPWQRLTGQTGKLFLQALTPCQAVWRGHNKTDNSHKTSKYCGNQAQNCVAPSPTDGG